MELLLYARRYYRHDFKVQEIIVFYDTHELWGAGSVTELELTARCAFKLASNSNRTLGHLPCPNAQGTPHRCVALFQDSSNSL